MGMFVPDFMDTSIVSIQLAIETKSERHLLEHFATENTENTEK